MGLWDIWDNIPALRSVSHSLMWCAVVLAILAAGATGLRYYIDRRISGLSASAQTAREDKLRSEIDNERQRREAAELKVGALQAILEVQCSGDWLEPYPLAMLSTPYDEFYVYFKHGQGPNAKMIKLYATEPYQFTTIDSSHAKFKARQGVRSGEFPIGQNREVISEFETLGFHIPFWQLSDFRSLEITVESLHLTLILNGVSGKPLQLQSPIVVPIRTYPPSKIPWASFEIAVHAFYPLPE